MIKKLVLSTLFILLTSGLYSCISHQEPPPRVMWMYQLQNASPTEISKTEYELVVIDYSYDGTEEGEYTQEEIGIIKDSGKIVIAYLSIGEAENYRFYWKEEWNTQKPEWILEENEEWPGNFAVEYWREEWKNILSEYIKRIANQDFDGLYLDKVDSFEYIAGKNILSENEAAKRMKELVEFVAEEFRKYKKDGIIILQNGERIIEYQPDVAKIVNGWVVEDMFFYETQALPRSWTDERLAYLNQVKGDMEYLLCVDYVDDGSESEENKERIKTFIQKSLENGFSPYVAYDDRKLDRINFRVFDYMEE